ncbi:MAG: glycosyltransferase family 4 protein [Elusimicrobiaceae bacterium]|nr:glycosyltransferase family 4 protein [Elusimicrobiaceae bacterium]
MSAEAGAQDYRDISAVVVSASLWPHIGGAERQALEQARYLAAHGVPVRILTRRLPGTLKKEKVRGVDVLRLPALGTAGFINSLSFMFSLLWWLVRRSGEYEVIHVHFASSPVLPACLAGRLLGKKVLAKIGGGVEVGEIPASMKTVQGRLKLWALRRFRPQFLIVNRDILPDMRKAGLDTETALYFPNAVDTDAFTPAEPDEKARLRRELGLSAGPVFIFTGRFAAEKRLDWLARAWGRAVSEAGPDCRPALLLVGEGEKRPLIESAARDNGALDKTLFLTGRRDNVLDYYRAADVFVLTSMSEGLSNSMLEAMACGLPVVASALAGAMDAVRDGHNGFLFRQDDEAALRAILVRLMKEPELARRGGAAARTVAVERFPMSALGPKLIRLYKEAAGS